MKLDAAKAAGDMAAQIAGTEAQIARLQEVIDKEACILGGKLIIWRPDGSEIEVAISKFDVKQTADMVAEVVKVMHGTLEALQGALDAM